MRLAQEAVSDPQTLGVEEDLYKTEVTVKEGLRIGEGKEETHIY